MIPSTLVLQIRKVFNVEIATDAIFSSAESKDAEINFEPQKEPILFTHSRNKLATYNLAPDSGCIQNSKLEGYRIENEEVRTNFPINGTIYADY